MYINNLITGTMTLGSGGSTPATRADTRFWTSNNENEYVDVPIEGELNSTTFSYGPMAYKIEIGSSVTSIGDFAFSGCTNLTSVTIPNSVTNIGADVFYECSYLANITLEGKNKTTVQGMTNYPFGLDNANDNGVTIHCTDEEIVIQHMSPL